MTKSTIERLVREKKWSDIKARMTRLHSSEAAEFLVTLDPIVQSLIFRALPRKFAAKVFAYLESEQQDTLLHYLTNQEANVLLSDLNPDDRTELFEEMPASATKRLMKLLNPEDLREARQLLGYPVDSVGREMTPDYLSIRPEWTVGEALNFVRANGKDKETVDVIFITDENGILLGDVKLKYLIFSDQNEKVGKFIKDTAHPLALSAFDDQEKAVQMIKKFNVIALPVVDSDGVLLGIVTVDDLIDIEEEEVTEDFQKFGGIAIEPGDLSLSNIAGASINLLYRKRIIWLMLLVGMNIFSGAAISLFEDVIANAVVLVFFLPLLIGSGGNAGSQATTLMVRALGTGDVKIGDWARLLGREFLVAGLLGGTMALGVSAIGAFRGGSDIAVITAMAMFAIVVVGSTIGMSMPFIFSKFKVDPAAASGPLVASIADICGVFIYFSIAQWYLGL